MRPRTILPAAAVVLASACGVLTDASLFGGPNLVLEADTMPAAWAQCTHTALVKADARQTNTLRLGSPRIDQSAAPDRVSLHHAGAEGDHFMVEFERNATTTTTRVYATRVYLALVHRIESIETILESCR